MNSVLEAIASDALDPEGPHLITVDELRAAGALDVPAAWRKSLDAGCERSAPIDESAFPLFAAQFGGESNDSPSAEESQR